MYFFFLFFSSQREEHANVYYPNGSKYLKSDITMFQVVFALSARTKYTVVQEYHGLSKLLGAAIRYEER